MRLVLVIQKRDCRLNSTSMRHASAISRERNLIAFFAFSFMILSRYGFYLIRCNPLILSTIANAERLYCFKIMVFFDDEDFSVTRHCY
jgi:hypothetical protein